MMERDKEGFTVKREMVENFSLRSIEDLCKLSEVLGYKDTGRFAINQLQCNNGAFVSSLNRFFDDNPGAMEAVKDWVLENMRTEEEEDNEE